MPVPYIVALAMASSMAMTPAGCPSPFWPSTRPVARSSRATVGSAHGWMYPRRHHSTYFGSMPIPCESTPRRSVLTMSRAVTSAAVRGIFIAMRTPTMKSCRCVWVTTTGASVMVVPVPSEAGDLEAGVLELVAAVDRGEERGDAFERPGVGERADVDRAEPDRASELAHGLLGGGGGAAEQQIALDRLVGFRELVGGDVVEGGDDVRLGQERLDLLGRGARRRRRVETRATEGERHHGADDDLAPAAIAQRAPSPAPSLPVPPRIAMFIGAWTAGPRWECEAAGRSTPEASLSESVGGPREARRGSLAPAHSSWRHRNRSRAGSRRSGFDPSSPGWRVTPRTIAAGMRSSLPMTGSAADASSSASARMVAWSGRPAGSRSPR